jgi:hypothetical protein
LLPQHLSGGIKAPYNKVIVEVIVEIAAVVQGQHAAIGQPLQVVNIPRRRCITGSKIKSADGITVGGELQDFALKGSNPKIACQILFHAKQTVHARNLLLKSRLGNQG